MRTACARTYSVDQGLAEVPRLARKHGLRVLLGLWIGRNRAENELELERGLAVIARDADVIDAVIVGNEVLLRRELPAAELAKYIGRVAAATPLPVTYGDGWEFWLRPRARGRGGVRDRPSPALLGGRARADRPRRRASPLGLRPGARRIPGQGDPRRRGRLAEPGSATAGRRA